MEIEILDKKENPLLERKEVRFNVTYEGPVPSKQDVRKELLRTLKSDGKLTIVDSLKPTFGKRMLSGYVKVYGNAEAMKIEPEHKIKKNIAEEKPAEAPAETKEE